MNTAPQPFLPVTASSDAQVDELLASTANLVEKPFDVDDDWGEVTREYDLRAFEPKPVSTADSRSTVQMLKDGRVGLDLFLNEASVALIVGHQDLTEFQRGHLTRIVTYIQALTDRLDKVMAKK